MPVNRLASLVRSAAAYRVEACFIAALAFTLANQADDRRHHTFDLRATTTRHTVVHEVEPVRVVASVREVAPAPAAASGTRFRVVSTGGATTSVTKADSTAFTYCSTTSSAGAAGRSEDTCKVIRIMPGSGGVVISKATAAGT